MRTMWRMRFFWFCPRPAATNIRVQFKDMASNMPVATRIGHFKRERDCGHTSWKPKRRGFLLIVDNVEIELPVPHHLVHLSYGHIMATHH